MLQSLNLKVGDTSYEPDIARNAVKRMMYNGAEIKAGTKVPMGSSISFVLGSGLGNTDIMVPDMYGLTVEQALSRIASLNLSRGSINSRAGVITDTLNAYVIDQEPKAFIEPEPGKKVENKTRPGALMDLFISSTPPAPRTDSTKTP
jgi:beta-lactam-binding protein with PASTA domain